jgi:hypothetical protein
VTSHIPTVSAMPVKFKNLQSVSLSGHMQHQAAVARELQRPAILRDCSHDVAVVQGRGTFWRSRQTLGDGRARKANEHFHIGGGRHGGHRLQVQEVRAGLSSPFAPPCSPSQPAVHASAPSAGVFSPWARYRRYTACYRASKKGGATVALPQRMRCPKWGHWASD